VHFDAGYVPAHHSVEAFAQALRAVGEQVFGRAATEIPMSRVLTQQFEITALYEMRLRPELVLLQKTMATVEGVARRIYPEHNIWQAADPVVRRWILRELSPPARIKRFADEAATAMRNLARLIENPPTATTVEIREERRTNSRVLWFALGAAASGVAFLLGLLFR
jgi:ubiquinone biosynthesis protein